MNMQIPLVPTQSFYAQQRASIVRLGDRIPSRQPISKEALPQQPSYFKDNSLEK